VTDSAGKDQDGVHLARRVAYLVYHNGERLVCVGNKHLKEFSVPAATPGKIWAPIDSSPNGGVIVYVDKKNEMVGAAYDSSVCRAFYAEKAGAAGSEKYGQGAACGPDVLPESIQGADFDPAYVMVKFENPKSPLLYIGITSYIKNTAALPTENDWRPLSVRPGIRKVWYYSPRQATPEVAIYDRPGSHLSPFRLLENTRYSWALLKTPTDAPTTTSIEDGRVIMPRITAQKIQPAKKICDAKEADDETGESAGGNWLSFRNDSEDACYLERDGKGPAGSFNFRNFLGTATLMLAGKPLLRLESTSLKIGYEDEYMQMLKELSEESLGNILNLNSITAAHLNADTTTRSGHVFGRYLLLTATLPLPLLKGSLAIIKAKPHTRLESATKWLPAGMASGRYAMSDPIGRIRWIRDRTANSSPSPHEVLEEKRVETTDTPPNQFIKYALSDFADICEQLARSEEPLGRHVTEAAVYAKQCRRLLRSEHLSNCRDLHQIPFDSQVLQKRSGYREVFRSWVKSHLGLRILELSANGLLSPQAENKDAPKLYELWLVSYLKRALNSVGNKQIFTSQPAQNGAEITLFPNMSDSQGNEPIHLVEDAQGNLLALYYNRTFKSTEGKPWRHDQPKKIEVAAKRPSYTVELKPDYTVEIIRDRRKGGEGVDNGEIKSLKSYTALRDTIRPENGGDVTYIHFDAKFRVNDFKHLSEEDPTKATASDIHKMHAYNEAIYGSITSVVLYPGNEDGDHGQPRFSDLIPGVYALSIRPRRDDQPKDGTQLSGDISVKKLKAFIESVIELSSETTGSRLGKHETSEPGRPTYAYKHLREIEIQELLELAKKKADDGKPA
jgi:predicted component of viral defense system (DUF524 family)